MATVLLVRHARSTANASGLLTGRQKGVHLDDVGRQQALATAERLAAVPLARIVSSPMERTRETAKAIASAQSGEVISSVDKGITECDYGEWQGQALKDLMKHKLFKVIRSQPSAVVFPGGEAMAAMSARASQTVRRLDAAVTAEHGADAVWVAVSHGDPIKAILADALGLHLDQFQRLHVDPASVSIVRYTEESAYVLATNSGAGDLSWLAPKKGGRARSHAPVVGGGAGPAATS
jgi:probable phosphomutase (TIGR03848 family)